VFPILADGVAVLGLIDQVPERDRGAVAAIVIDAAHGVDIFSAFRSLADRLEALRNDGAGFSARQLYDLAHDVVKLQELRGYPIGSDPFAFVLTAQNEPVVRQLHVIVEFDRLLVEMNPRLEEGHRVEFSQRNRRELTSDPSYVKAAARLAAAGYAYRAARNVGAFEREVVLGHELTLAGSRDSYEGRCVVARLLDRAGAVGKEVYSIVGGLEGLMEIPQMLDLHQLLKGTSYEKDENARRKLLEGLFRLHWRAVK
jgi:hypothetical protein